MMPLVNDIHAPMPIYRGCTLSEVLMLGALSLLLSTLISVLLFSLLWGMPLLGLVLGLLSSLGVTRLAVGVLSRHKADKPLGYYQQHLRQQLTQRWGYPSPWLLRLGAWSVG